MRDTSLEEVRGVGLIPLPKCSFIRDSNPKLQLQDKKVSHTRQKDSEALDIDISPTQPGLQRLQNLSLVTFLLSDSLICTNLVQSLVKGNLLTSVGVAMDEIVSGFTPSFEP